MTKAEFLNVIISIQEQVSNMSLSGPGTLSQRELAKIVGEKDAHLGSLLIQHADLSEQMVEYINSRLDA